MPDTLDLAERGRLAVGALTSFLNEKQGHAPYGQNFLNADPPYLGRFEYGPPNWGNIIESLIMARQMSGSVENLSIDQLTITGMLRDLADRDPKIPSTIDVGRFAIMSLHQVDPQPELVSLFDGLARREMAAATRNGINGVFYWDPEPDLGESHIGIQRHGMTLFVSGLAIHALSRWSKYSNQDGLLVHCRQLVDYALQPKYWTPEGAPKAVVGHEHAQFDGHHHSQLSFLKGVLCFAERTNDVRLKQFVRDGYEYFRKFGLARIGAFGEGCSTGDMVFLAIKLSDLGVGDYWEDVDQYVRNHLVELQITDAQRLHAIASKMPKGRGNNDTEVGPLKPQTESDRRAIERSIGAYWSDGSHPSKIPAPCMLYTICCTGNCVPALYGAWEAIVRCDEGNARINLLLNRSSEWLDIDSYLPFEGKVVIRNKTAKSIAVRMPLWVDLEATDSRIDGELVGATCLGRYLVFESVQPKCEVTITFAVKETIETWTLKWRPDQFWQECTNPGTHWQPGSKPSIFTMRFRANTLIDIEPRDSAAGFPLYRRDRYRSERTPMTTVTRFVPVKTIDW
ncbi:MAG: hypothetical protein SGJ20_03550 [Planctomycetota bacterium]|nr:hypothetical protein [Planctomycetota bacterium]